MGKMAGVPEGDHRIVHRGGGLCRGGIQSIIICLRECSTTFKIFQLLIICVQYILVVSFLYVLESVT